MLPCATGVVMTVVVVDTSVVAAGVVDWTVVVSTVLVVDPRVVTAVVSTVVVAVNRNKKDEIFTYEIVMNAVCAAAEVVK